MTVARDIAAWISASTTKKGPIEKATQAETDAGTAGLYITPETLDGVAVVPGGLISEEIFTANGTWTKPAGCSHIEVFLVGGGGGGGGCQVSSSPEWRLSGGGGGGGFQYAYFDASNFGSTVSVVVGAGGAGGVGNNDGSGGGTSSFNGTSGSYYTYVTGGSGGNYALANFYGLNVSGGQGIAFGDIVEFDVVGGPSGRGLKASGGHALAGGGGCSFTGAHHFDSQVVGTTGATNGVSAPTGSYGLGGGGAAIVDLSSTRTGGSGYQGLVIVRAYG